MIKGKIKKDLSIDTVLSFIRPYDIYKYYMPYKEWSLDRITKSPFHEDKTPSFMIGHREGGLYHIDFSRALYRGGCFDFVQQLLDLSSLDEVLKRIDVDFGLGISSSSTKDYKRIISEYKQPEDLGKRYSLIQVKTRKFTQEELQYWKQYSITKEDLISNNIYSIETVYLNRQKYPLKETELRFAYLYEGSYWKIYSPHENRKKKWLSNVPLNLAYGLNNLQPNKNTLITDSLKDYMVCRKVYEHVCQVQNESISAFSKETVNYINDNSKYIYLGYDSDTAGKMASNYITKTFGWKHINTPDKYLPEIKDWSDWTKECGLEVIRNHFITKGLYD